MINSSNKFLNLGRVQKAKGVKGEFKVISFGDFFLHLSKEESISLYESNDPKDGLLIDPKFIKDITIESSKKQQKYFILKAKDIDSRKEVELWKGLYIGLKLEDAIRRFSDSENPYLFEYLDLRVMDSEDHKLLGKISRIEENGSNIIFVIQPENGSKEFMLPAKSDYIVKTEISKNRILTKDLNQLIEE